MLTITLAMWFNPLFLNTFNSKLLKRYKHGIGLVTEVFVIIN